MFEFIQLELDSLLFLFTTGLEKGNGSVNFEYLYVNCICICHCRVGQVVVSWLAAIEDF